MDYEDRSWKVCEICGEEARTPVQIDDIDNNQIYQDIVKFQKKLEPKSGFLSTARIL